LPKEAGRYSVYLLYWYFTGTKVQILTLLIAEGGRQLLSFLALLVLYSYKSTNTDAAVAGRDEAEAFFKNMGFTTGIYIYIYTYTYIYVLILTCMCV
jgi:hypothetical protein